jgi:hypothetical protein
MNRHERRKAAAKARENKAGKRTALCRGCGAIVICEDATCTLRHPKPICAAFDAAMKAAGMKPRHDPWLEMVRADGTIVDKGEA